MLITWSVAEMMEKVVSPYLPNCPGLSIDPVPFVTELPGTCAVDPDAPTHIGALELMIALFAPPAGDPHEVGHVTVAGVPPVKEMS